MSLIPKPMFAWEMSSAEKLRSALFDYIGAAAFPCVGAKAAVARGNLDTLACRDFANAWDDVRIHDRLMAFAATHRAEPAVFRGLAIMFEGPGDLDERMFEASLWERIQSLSDKDVWRGQRYDQAVSSDPGSPHFSLSFGGAAFFVVGLHPNASRPARRFPHPVMVFNLHDQFEVLRAQGRYDRMREAILKRDEALAGSRNPMIARHGEQSEAQQYSGRVVDGSWECPFQYKGEV